RFLLDLRESTDPTLHEALSAPLLQRFIGVIYQPDTERYSHYAQARLGLQFDAWVWFDETTAVTPLPRTLDTFPFV
ncbi:MAG TPA: erythromycin esterase family protein, partial [Pseudoxanthomonas sp.]|nr:erythromycin esterase family protein [Pseudoxanthomonas sp.]